MRLLFVMGAAALAGACATAAAPEAAPDASAELERIADAYLEATAAASPFIVYFGFGDVVEADHAAVPDRSAEALAEYQRKEDEYLAALEALDASAFTEGGEWATYHTLLEGLRAQKGLRVCKQHLWSLNHMFGWQTALGLLAQEQPVGTAEEKAAALARWSKLHKMIAEDRINLEQGLKEGYSVPKRIARRVVAQLDGLLEAPLDEHPLLDFARRAEDEAFAAEARRAVEASLLPAIAAYRDFLNETYIPAAREELAIRVLPKGAQCYEAMLRDYHSAAIGAKRTYERGQEAVASNRAGVIERGRAMFGVEDFGEILERVNDVPENRFSNEEELIEFTRALEPAAREAVAPLFSALPEQPIIVEPYPDFLKGTGQSSRYERSTEDERPAVYRINTDDWRDQTRGEAEIVLFHEAWPGHHLQIATARGVEGHPAARLLGPTAFIEGWGRYSEALAEEAGLYADGYGEITRRAWPARGMVVDPGLHVFGWTNEEAKAFLIESGRHSEQSAEDMLDRIAVIPGQLTSYDTGGLEIMALRREAEKRLGDKFDIRAFHDRVLENGAVPLAALRQHVEAWIKETEKAR